MQVVSTTWRAEEECGLGAIVDVPEVEAPKVRKTPRPEPLKVNSC